MKPGSTGRGGDRRHRPAAQPIRIDLLLQGADSEDCNHRSRRHRRLRGREARAGRRGRDLHRARRQPRSHPRARHEAHRHDGSEQVARGVRATDDYAQAGAAGPGDPGREGAPGGCGGRRTAAACSGPTPRWSRCRTASPTGISTSTAARSKAARCAASTRRHSLARHDPAVARDRLRGLSRCGARRARRRQAHRGRPLPGG